MRYATSTAAVFLLCTVSLFAQGGPVLDEQLLEAVWGGQCDSVGKLLKKGANPNARSEKVGTALGRASAICQAPVNQSRVCASRCRRMMSAGHRTWAERSCV